ncbi:unnamed protein product [Brassicogethes aeneus]|uniref:Protein crumbs n=1 Tax=Brassicogethes aeneus TaxID=1431903 RepID=A0A9P0FJC5_BRAAE|nr:unnamed protein product [Brassicogethes aeneus]
MEINGLSLVIANITYNTELLTSPSLYNEGAAVLLIGKQFNGCLLEGPSIVFQSSVIISNHNVAFEPCPIPQDSCVIENPPSVNFCIVEPCMFGTCLNGLKDYSCACHPRYTGKNCEIDLGDPCQKSTQPCKNGGTCTSNHQGHFSCICHPDFTGKTCDIDMSTQTLCQPRECFNGALCEVSQTTGVASCICEPGFIGEKCEINVDECASNPCVNGGICNDGINNFTCDCTNTGYHGRMCQLDINECLNTPCYNHGICFNTYGSFVCQCMSGFKGRQCELDINECEAHPCLNNGECMDLKGGFKCKCAPGFVGDRCEIEQHALGMCDSTTCPPYADCAPVGKTFACRCKADSPGEFPNCGADLVCANNPCKNGGVCTSHLGIFNCTCQPGFAGKVCQINVDECGSMPCQNGGACTDLANGFECNCTDEWMGDMCEIAYDACKLKPCRNNSTCTIGESIHDFLCECLSGFEGNQCEINIDDCVGAKCGPGKVCVDLINDHECKCPTGYTGDDCTIISNPCLSNPCSNSATCNVNEETHEYTCICAPGYKGRNCKTDIDECQTTEKICNQGICVNNVGSFQCYCMPGFTGERCELDFDECLSMPCQNNATCLNKINNYECKCPPGYKGKDCSTNIDECEPNPCKNGATCIDGVNDFTCVCQQGLTGKLCQTNIDDCESSPCLHGAICIDGLNDYTCNCSSTGYEGHHCDINIDECLSNPCQNGALCVDQVKDYECKCYNGYRGKNCEIDINECEVNPCKNNGVCLEKSNQTLYLPTSAELYLTGLPELFNKTFSYLDAAGYVCKCVDGVAGENCQINIDECQSNPCFRGQCKDYIGYFECECEEGFEGERCDVDIDECELKPCMNGTCIDKKADYYCDCDPLYGGKNCSVVLVGCKDKPCLNDAQCKPYLVNETDHKYNCSCLPGFYGSKCEQPTTMSLSGNSLVMVNTTREEGYDIQFRFKTTLGDGLLALGKGLTYYILELSKGKLNLHSSLLNKWEGVFIGSNLNNSEWQKVFVAINSTHLVLSANDEQTIYPISFNENYNVSSTSFPLTYIGGIPSNLRKLTHGQPFLVGCTEDVLINGEWVLPQDTESNNFYNVEVGCTRKPQCDPNPCRSGGQCTDRWRDFSCTCERPYLGHTCQYNYTAATFGYENITNSMVTVDVHDSSRRAVRTIVDISMFIRTRQSKGHIFYLGSNFSPIQTVDETYIAAQLESGELLVSIYFNGSLESYAVGGVKLDNGYNHLIEVIRNATLVQVKLNGTEYFRKTISGAGSLDAQVLYLGGQPQQRSVRQAMDNNMVTTKVDLTAPTGPAAVTASLNSVNFKGIIQDVQISNGSTVMVVEFYPLKPDDLRIPASFGDVSFDKMTVLEGIHSDNLCKVNPCEHAGQCEVTWNDYRCQCVVGFKGKNCKELEFCELEGCPDGAVCNNLEDGYECISNATFNGKSDPLQYGFTILPNSSKAVTFDRLELTYRTRSWGTVLFAKFKDNYFVIFIYHNEVIVEWSFNGVVDTRRFRKDRFVGQWLTLYFTYKDSVFRGGFKENVMDESPNFEASNFDFNSFTEIFMNGSIYIAGSDNKKFDYENAIKNTDFNMTGYIPEVDTTTSVSLTSNSLEVGESQIEDVALHKVDQNKQTDRFKGCLTEIRIGGLLLPFFTTKELYKKHHYSKEFFELLPDTHADIGCILCYDGDCFNQGYCINPMETYKCNCTEGYTADDCSLDINECENNKCQNNATCVDLIAKYQCNCPDGYEGEHCELDIDECASNPCRHGGQCIDLIGNFKCNCPEDFIGKQCEAPLLVTCDNKPCFEGATCETGPNEKTGNNFTCFCTEGMEGSLCDTPFCLRKPCDNGQCINNTGEVPYCQCPTGFEGKFCEIDIDECALSIGGNPCQHDGTCIDKIAGYVCDCNNTGYTGLLCEIDIDECQTYREACGRAGKCENLPGSYRCTCDINGKCGHHCDLDDPCEADHPCTHGDCHSQCVDKSDYFCQCHENYTGKNCTEPKILASKSDDGFNILYIVIPIVLIILIGMAVVMIVLVNVARSKRATRGTYSPSAQEFCNPRVELDHVLKPPPEERLI